MEKKIIRVIGEKGPLTGSELFEMVAGDHLSLWRACKLSNDLAVRSVGRRYLRLDRRVDGFGRLSPSILREFLTYSVIGLAKAPLAVHRKIETVTRHIREVSQSKWDIAYRTICSVVSHCDSEPPLERQACFIIAGDIVHDMAHDVLRPERSTGKMVNGSDMDIVVILDDDCNEDVMRRLDETIYRQKQELLIAPHLKEEIDYVVKRLRKVREQVRFEDFRHMVACKILHEGRLLWGSQEMFHRVKAMLREEGVDKKLHDLEVHAIEFRCAQEACLLSSSWGKMKDVDLNLFYPAEESEEFE